ncbi:hypothetical protein BC937DRAFT_94945 [Endogone sp. FLAS-F59071]|nr:hypothetical protein BC937DRAFT_94945 [Endogone sp. FLAS-F59071]|eukprot:RUS13683.1 hypothetical protein BC937DRAFT_94945 [Endogone sp. FLAS-F59071]
MSPQKVCNDTPFTKAASSVNVSGIPRKAGCSCPGPLPPKRVSSNFQPDAYRAGCVGALSIPGDGNGYGYVSSNFF